MDKLYFMTSADYYLSKNIILCNFIRYAQLDNNKPCVIVKLSEEIDYVEENKRYKSNFAILLDRHSDRTIMNISQFPTSAYLTFLKQNTSESYKNISIFNPKKLLNWAIVELYDNYSDAYNGNIYNYKYN